MNASVIPNSSSLVKALILHHLTTNRNQISEQGDHQTYVFCAYLFMSFEVWTTSTLSSSAGRPHSTIGASCQNVVYARDVSKVRHDNKRTPVPFTVPRVGSRESFRRRVAIINHYDFGDSRYARFNVRLLQVLLPLLPSCSGCYLKHS
jgi:hypothetical protein